MVSDLRLRSSRRLLLDTNAFIYFLSGQEPYLRPLAALFRRVQQGQASVVVSVITEAELRVRPERQRDQSALELIEDLLSEDGINVIGVDRRIGRRAAAVRAVTGGIGLPDAIIIATALETACDLVVGNDRAWAKVSGLPFFLLDGDLTPSNPAGEPQNVVNEEP